jgi:hypothetical protein
MTESLESGSPNALPLTSGLFHSLIYEQSLFCNLEVTSSGVRTQSLET